MWHLEGEEIGREKTFSLNSPMSKIEDICEDNWKAYTLIVAYLYIEETQFFYIQELMNVLFGFSHCILFVKKDRIFPLSHNWLIRPYLCNRRKLEQSRKQKNIYGLLPEYLFRFPCVLSVTWDMAIYQTELSSHGRIRTHEQAGQPCIIRGWEIISSLFPNIRALILINSIV